jgi:hypothetical protein
MEVQFDPEYQAIFDEERALREQYSLPYGSVDRPDTHDTLHKLIPVEVMDSRYLSRRRSDAPVDFLIPHRLLHVKKVRHSNQWEYLDNFDFPPEFASKVAVCGGAALAGVVGGPLKDVDVFVIADDPITVLRQILKYAIGEVVWNGNVVTIQAIEFPNGRGLINVQVILRRYNSVSEVIHGFDIDCCCVAYYMGKLYATKRGDYALRHWKNTINLFYSSTSYEYRLMKYLKRGFDVQLPSCVSDRVMNIAYGRPPNYCPRIKFKHNLGWLIRSFIKARSNYDEVIDPTTPQSDYELRISQIISFETYLLGYGKGELKDYVIQVIVPSKHVNVLFDGTLLVHQDKFKFAPEIQFITINPGAQNNSWSFHPMEIAWEQWFDEAVLWKSSTQTQVLVTLTDQPDYVPPLYYRYPRSNTPAWNLMHPYWPGLRWGRAAANEHYRRYGRVSIDEAMRFFSCKFVEDLPLLRHRPDWPLPEDAVFVEEQKRNGHRNLWDQI